MSENLLFEPQEFLASIEARVKSLGVTIQDFCCEAGVSITAWYAWKRGDYVPTMRSMRMLDSAVKSLESDAA